VSTITHSPTPYAFQHARDSSPRYVHSQVSLKSTLSLLFSAQIRMNFLFLQSLVHAALFSSSLMYSFCFHSMKSTHYNAVFCSLHFVAVSLSPDTLLSIPFFQHLTLCSSLRVGDRFSRPLKRAEEIQSCILQSLCYKAVGKRLFSALNGSKHSRYVNLFLIPS
jgi:hypothetical protein